MYRRTRAAVMVGTLLLLSAVAALQPTSASARGFLGFSPSTPLAAARWATVRLTIHGEGAGAGVECSGAVVSKSPPIVLTARHCVTGRPAQPRPLVVTAHIRVPAVGNVRVAAIPVQVGWGRHGRDDVAAIALIDPAAADIPPPIPVAKDLPAMLERVTAIGYPGGSRNAVMTSGDVLVPRWAFTLSWPVFHNVTETGFGLAPGDSGGPLVNGTGDLIGVTIAGNMFSRYHLPLLSRSLFTDAPVAAALVLDVLERPYITSVSSDGADAGGERLLITGTGLAGVDQVYFGKTLAPSFTVEGPDRIVATVPRGQGTVDVRVTSINGTSPATAQDRYTYAVPAVSSAAGGVHCQATHLDTRTRTRAQCADIEAVLREIPPPPWIYSAAMTPFYGYRCPVISRAGPAVIWTHTETVCLHTSSRLLAMLRPGGSTRGSVHCRARYLNTWTSPARCTGLKILLSAVAPPPWLYAAAPSAFYRQGCYVNTGLASVQVYVHRPRACRQVIAAMHRWLG